MRPQRFVEAFAGGGIVSLTVAAEGLADRVVMVEKDEDVAALWHTIIDGHAHWLATRVVDFKLTAASLQRELSVPARSLRNRAFQTLLKSRTHRGGILAPGSSPLKRGENGKGITSRWYPQTLKQRIVDIRSSPTPIVFIEGDGLSVLRKNAKRADALFFLDPPYTVGGTSKNAGSRLYRHCEIDHEELFSLVHSLKGDFLMTYDRTQEVIALAKQYRLDVEPIRMRNTHQAAMIELLIGRDLAWARVGGEKTHSNA